MESRIESVMESMRIHMMPSDESEDSDSVLTKKEIKELRLAFDVFETFEGSDVILTKNLGKVLRSLGQNLMSHEIQTMQNILDENGNGRITFGDFVSAMEDNMKANRIDQELQEAFRVFDKDGSGLVPIQEIRSVLTTAMGKDISQKELDEMEEDMDMNGDGELDYKEYVALMKTD